MKNIHIEFKVIPTPGPDWGTCKRVDITIPKRKFKTLEGVYDKWYKRTGNVAQKIVMLGEREVG